MDPMTLMGIGTGVNTLTQGLGAFFGRSDSKRAERRQMQLIERSLAENAAIADQYNALAQGALQTNQQSVDILSMLPAEIAAGFDAGLAAELNRTVEMRTRERAASSMSAGRMGLGGTTIAAQQRRAIDRLAGRTMAEQSAAFAGGRASAVASATGMQASAIQQQAGMQAQVAAQEAAIRQFGPQLLGNTQIVPPNTGQQIGQIGAGFSSSLNNMALMQALASS